MTREEAAKYFERKIRNFGKSMAAAMRRGDEGAAQGLKRKAEIYEQALKALREEQP